jgi:hypothetical protein
MVAAFLAAFNLVQTAERVDHNKNGKWDTEQPQQQITSHERASELNSVSIPATKFSSSQLAS